MKIITISGVDGSGKSTQLELLSAHLTAHGAHVSHFHAITFSIANRKKSLAPGTAKAVTTAPWFSVQMRKVAFLIDLLCFERHVSTLAAAGVTHILSDRYFYDSLINMAYLSKGRTHWHFGINILARLVRVPDQAFYLHVSPEELRARDREIEQDAEYLVDKTRLYQQYAPLWSITTIDGQRSVDVISDEITHAVDTYNRPL